MNCHYINDEYLNYDIDQYILSINNSDLYSYIMNHDSINPSMLDNIDCDFYLHEYSISDLSYMILTKQTIDENILINLLHNDEYIKQIWENYPLNEKQQIYILQKCCYLKNPDLIIELLQIKKINIKHLRKLIWFNPQYALYLSFFYFKQLKNIDKKLIICNLYTINEFTRKRYFPYIFKILNDTEEWINYLIYMMKYEIQHLADMFAVYNIELSIFQKNELLKIFYQTCKNIRFCSFTHDHFLYLLFFQLIDKLPESILHKKILIRLLYINPYAITDLSLISFSSIPKYLYSILIEFYCKHEIQSDSAISFIRQQFPEYKTFIESSILLNKLKKK